MRILFVEDSPQDMTLILRALKKEGLEVEHSRVASLAELKNILSEKWDIILSDFNLPGFTAVDVLRTLKEKRVSAPVIVISSAVSDETAAELMRSGAADFVRKENTSRLVPAILRELQSEKNRFAQQDQLKSSELQFRILANSIPQLAWMTDKEGYIFWYNENWYDYTGTTLDQMKGWGWESIHHPEHVERVTNNWRQHLSAGLPWEDTFPLKSKMGDWRWFLSRATPFKDENGKIIHWCGTNTDITEQIKLREEAINASSLKSAFLANMSHEIRTPLAAILGFADILKNSDSNGEERTQYLDIITRNGHALTKIIDDILDLSKIEAGKLEIEKMPLCLSDLTRDVVAMFADRAKGKGVDLLFDSSHFPNFKIDSDSIRIRQILINLIGNAIKFTSQGSVLVKGSYAELEKGQIGLKIQVVDTGIGLSQEHIDRLFVPFTQADNKNSRRYGGTGLGLALSRKLGIALDGDVRIERSDEGTGSTFVFEFVTRKSKNIESKKTLSSNGSSAQPEMRLDGKKILVVDDSPDNRELMNIYLKREGAKIDSAGDGESAVKMALKNDYDVVLMDIQMPGLDGYQALAQLRSMKFKKPVLALTAHAMKEEKTRALAAGFSDHISKPVNYSELVEAILIHSNSDKAPGSKSASQL